jgi:hypothetical protein
VRLHDAPGDGETETGAGDARGGVALDAVELVEHVGQVAGRDPDAGIDDPKPDRCALGRGGGLDHDLDPSSVPRVLDRVADEVPEHLGEPGPDAGDERDDRRLDRDGDALGLRG